MKAEEIDKIEDVLNLSQILSNHGEDDAAHTPSLIASLIDWRDRSLATVEAVAPAAPAKAAAKAAPAKKAAAKVTKAAASERNYEPTPDPSESNDSDDF